MKKIILNTLALIAFSSLIFVSCEKDESEKHEYTPEELAEIRRQDSLKNIIPASYVFAQDVTLPYSNFWEPIGVKLVEGKDTAKLLELFEYNTIAELVAALGTLEGDPPDQVQTGHDITFYAYNWSTKYAVEDPSTTNNFGHWFDANGDVTTWGSGQMVYCEKVEGPTLDFNIGHLPGDEGPEVGDVFHIVEAMKYDTTKVAFVFNLTIGEEPEPEYPETTLEATLDLALSVDAAGADVWVDNLLALDSAAIQTAIGCWPQEADLYGVNESTDSLYVEGLTANNGCWFDASGDVCSWGAEGISMYVEYRPSTQEIGCGQMPEACVSGTTYYGRLAFVNGDKRAEVKVAMTIN